MRYQKLIIFVCFYISLYIGNAFAQAVDDQLLIFRNTDEVTLLHLSEMDSIVTTRFDAEGKIYDEPTSQVFYAKDTTIVVPIAEIDSVSFGAKNEIVFNDKVRKLSTDIDLPWIVRYDGNSVFYSSNTPQDILPTMGQYLFYNQFDATFPCGLTAKVIGVATKGNEIEVKLVSADYTEIFDKFFYAGPISELDETVNKAKGIESVLQTTAEISSRGELKGTLSMEGVGVTSIKGTYDVSGDVVLHPFSNYYHADVTMDMGINHNFQFQTDESTSVELEKNLVTIPLPPVAAIFRPSLSLGLFLDAKAEMNFNFDMERHFINRFVWERKGDKQTFTKQHPKDKVSNNVAKLEVVLNGSVYAGVQSQFDFNLVGNSLGARAKLKYGPEVYGELSLGLLNDLEKEYNPEMYGSAELSLQNKLQFQGFAITRNIVWGEEHMYNIFEFESVGSKRKIDLFPRFFASRAVEVKKDNIPQISVAAKSNNEIVSKLETGFQVVDKEENVLSETFVDEIKADTTAVQIVTTELPVPSEVKDLEDVKVRPVFKYASKTIPFANIGISQNPNIQPIIAYGSNGSASFVSGVPVVGTSTTGNTIYHIGPYIPIAIYDKDFHKTSPYLGHSAEYVGDKETSTLYGTWKANIDDKDVIVTFEVGNKCSVDFGTGVMDDATYYVNCPQSGYLTINSERSPVIMQLIKTEASRIVVKFRTVFDTNNEYVFTKQ